jgi:hypothetical protein
VIHKGNFDILEISLLLMIISAMQPQVAQQFSVKGRNSHLPDSFGIRTVVLPGRI